MQSILLESTGPIAKLEIPCPEEGGVVVLRGANDQGKSTAIRAIGRLLGGSGAFSVKDGASVARVEGFGITLTMRKNAQRKGVLECASIDSILNLGLLVDPKFADPEAADSTRIKALLEITDPSAELSQFAGIMPPAVTVEEVAGELTLNASNLVDRAACLKRDIERMARNHETARDKAAGRVATIRDELVSVPSGESDPDVLNSNHAAALSRIAELDARCAAAATAENSIAGLEESIRSMESMNTTTIDQLESDVAYANSALDEINKEIAALYQKLTEAKDREQQWKEKRNTANGALRAAKERAENLISVRKKLDSHREAVATRPNGETIELAHAALATAKQAIDNGFAIRQAKKKQKDLELAEQEVVAAGALADAFRKSADAVDGVLSSAVDSPALWVENGRLMSTHPERGPVRYGERSEGTRWCLAMDEVIRRVRSAAGDSVPVIIPIPQEGWECLDNANRIRVAKHAKACRAVIVTAEADFGPVRAEIVDIGETPEVSSGETFDGN